MIIKKNLKRVVITKCLIYVCIKLIIHLIKLQVFFAQQKSEQCTSVCFFYHSGNLKIQFQWMIFDSYMVSTTQRKYLLSWRRGKREKKRRKTNNKVKPLQNQRTRARCCEIENGIESMRLSSYRIMEIVTQRWSVCLWAGVAWTLKSVHVHWESTKWWKKRMHFFRRQNEKCRYVLWSMIHLWT
jgi:hypothetical protein